MLTSSLSRALPGPSGGAWGGCIRHSAAAISLTDRAAPGREAERGPTSPASRGHRTGGVSGGGCGGVGVSGAGPRRAAAREGLWTRTRRAARRREADPGRGGVAAAACGSGMTGGDGRRARWLPGRAMDGDSGRGGLWMGGRGGGGGGRRGADGQWHSLCSRASSSGAEPWGRVRSGSIRRRGWWWRGGACEYCVWRRFTTWRESGSCPPLSPWASRFLSFVLAFTGKEATTTFIWETVRSSESFGAQIWLRA
jgi:hypothetical protein